MSIPSLNSEMQNRQRGSTQASNYRRSTASVVAKLGAQVAEAVLDAARSKTGLATGEVWMLSATMLELAQHKSRIYSGAT
jgi:hypothetical protein